MIRKRPRFGRRRQWRLGALSQSGCCLRSSLILLVPTVTLLAMVNYVDYISNMSRGRSIHPRLVHRSIKVAAVTPHMKGKLTIDHHDQSRTVPFLHIRGPAWRNYCRVIVIHVIESTCRRTCPVTNGIRVSYLVLTGMQFAVCRISFSQGFGTEL